MQGRHGSPPTMFGSASRYGPRLRPCQYHGSNGGSVAAEETSMPSTFGFDTRQLFIAGQWREAASAKTLMLGNPSDGSALAPIARGMSVDIHAAVGASGPPADFPGRGLRKTGPKRPLR